MIATKIFLTVSVLILGTAYRADSRPFRVGVYKLDSERDQVKPLYPTNTSGVLLTSGMLVGEARPGWVTGLRIETGENIWWYQTESSLSVPPAAFGSWLVLGLRNGVLIKLDAATGKKVWQTEFDAFVSRPLRLMGSLILAATASQKLYAIDLQTGKRKWIYDGGFPEGMSMSGMAPPAFSGKKIYLGLSSGEIAAIDGESGKETWKFSPKNLQGGRFHDVIGEIVILENQLLFTRYDGTVGALDIRRAVPSLAWEERLPLISTSCFREGKYFVGTATGEVYALDPVKQGRQLWRTVFGESVRNILAGQDRVFVAGSKGRIMAIDNIEGAILWFDDLGNPIDTPPVFWDEQILFATTLKVLYAYKLTPGPESRVR